MRIAYMIVAAILLLLVVVFVVQNASIATVSLLSVSVTLPTSMLVVGAYVLGMVTGGAVFAFVRTVARGTRPTGPGGAA